MHCSTVRRTELALLPISTRRVTFEVTFGQYRQVSLNHRSRIPARRFPNQHAQLAKTLPIRLRANRSRCRPVWATTIASECAGRGGRSWGISMAAKRSTASP